MVAWGVDPFDNDDAADWAAAFDGADRDQGLRLVGGAFAAIEGGGYVSPSEGAIAVAAAQVVAWLRSPDDLPGAAYSGEVVDWVRRTATPPSGELVDAALTALARVRADDSYLAELEAQAGDEWLATITRLESVLAEGG